MMNRRIINQLIDFIKTTFLLAGWIFCLFDGYSQTVRYPLTCNYSGIGVYSKHFGDALSATNNQAALAKIQSLNAAVFAERRFLLKELNLYQIAFCLPLHSGGLGLSAGYSGYNDYNESRVGLGYGKTLGKIDMGIQFNYYSLRIAGYGAMGVVNFEVGTIFHISEQVHAGLHVFNPTGSKFGRGNLEKLSSKYTAGLGYEPSEKVYLGVEIIKEENKAVNINTGIQYAFARKVFARIGLYTESGNLYFGIGLKWARIHIEVTTSFHPQLGCTPGLMLVFEGKRKEE